jgi:hypothetical protein
LTGNHPRPAETTEIAPVVIDLPAILTLNHSEFPIRSEMLLKYSTILYGKSSLFESSQPDVRMIKIKFPNELPPALAGGQVI